MAKKSQGHDPQKYGTWAEWAAVAVALLGSTGVNVYFHYAESSAKTSDEHVKGLIAEALNPKVKEIDDRLEKVSLDVGKLTTDISNLKKAVETLSDSQSTETQKIIERLLSAAQKERKPEAMLRIVNTAASLVAVLQREKYPATPEFFQATTREISDMTKRTEPSIRTAAFAAKGQLAEYRSALQPQPELPKTVASDNTVAIQQAINAFLIPPGTGNRSVVFQPKIYQLAPTLSTRANVNLVGNGATALRANSAEPDMLVPPDTKTTQVTITGIIFIDGRQALDGFIWNNVTFVNMRIRYAGGTALLHNVRFVNCTFDLPSDQRGASIADYAALGRTDELRLG